jgi:predicted CopG family antitoxin
MTEIKNLESFTDILKRASERKGSEDFVLDMAGQTFTKEELAEIPDSMWLAAFTKQIFQSGFVWHP